MGWRTMFPNEKHELSVGCTEDRRVGRQALRLHKKMVLWRAAKKGGAGFRKGQPSGLP